MSMMQDIATRLFEALITAGDAELSVLASTVRRARKEYPGSYGRALQPIAVELLDAIAEADGYRNGDAERCERCGAPKPVDQSCGCFDNGGQ